MSDRINDCKKIFCNPNCKQNGKGYKKRYVCPVCKKYFDKIKEKGAITSCRHDEIIYQ